MDIEKIAELACLSFSPEEKEKLARDMAEILAFADGLPALETEDDLTDVAVDVCALREDVSGACLPRDELLASAKSRTDAYITVPRIRQE